MTTNRLTDRAIASAKPRERQYALFDGDGLYILLMPNSSKLWRIEYEFQGQPGLLSLGKYPKITLARAREKRVEIHDLIDSGINPSEHRKQQRRKERLASDESVESLIKSWFERRKKGARSAATAAACWRRLEQYVLPEIGKRNFLRLVPQDYESLVRSIAEAVGPEVAKRIFFDLKKLTRFAYNERLIKIDGVITSGVEHIFERYTKTNHARINLNDYPKLLRCIDAHRRLEVRCALDLMSRLFLRTMELLDAPWNEFDFKAARWSIPASRMKMKTPHIVPLSTQSLGILAVLKGLALSNKNQFWQESGMVFPWVGEGRRNTLLKALYSMGYKGQMTGHGFRTLAKSAMLCDLKIDEKFIEIQLAHFKRDAYIVGQEFYYLDERREMMQRWSDHLDNLRSE